MIRFGEEDAAPIYRQLDLDWEEDLEGLDIAGVSNFLSASPHSADGIVCGR